MEESPQQGEAKAAHRLIRDSWLVVRYTRRWLHYGVIGFTVLCSLIAAVRGAFAR
jgi:hypothetical protein